MLFRLPKKEAIDQAELSRLIEEEYAELAEDSPP